ncbi:hypothetical protein ACIQLJ_13660 [Microbacterium sp. NPDC091313]
MFKKLGTLALHGAGWVLEQVVLLVVLAWGQLMLHLPMREITH